MKPRHWLFALAALIVATVVAVVAVEDLRWRAQVIGLHLQGEIPDIELGQLVRMLRPGSGQWLKGMLEYRSPYEFIVNPYKSEADRQRGAALFGGGCAGCHGADARGTDIGPSLIGRPFKLGNTPWGTYRSIRYGVPGTAMPPHALADRELWQLVAFITRENRLAREGPELAAAAPALSAAITAPFNAVRAPLPGGDWLTYSGSYSGVRHSTLTAITPANVAGLAPRWIHQLEGLTARVEATPIVRDGVMYVTVPPASVVALDARSGATLWRFDHRMPPDISPACCASGPVNRGVAILDDRVFIGTADARLIALSARTGQKLWDTQFADHRLGYSVTGAPLALRDLVLTGVGGGDLTTRGFVVALDAATGEERWRFFTIPGPGEPGHDTWQGDSWKTGGTATWMTGSYDPSLDLVYWSTGNASPNFNASSRSGDNLYSNSVVALEGATGKLRWHFQFTPADPHDWDATQIPVLADAEFGGRSRQLLYFANRNAFYYVLDRVSGEYLLGKAFSRQNWADGLDERGRPRALESAVPTRTGVVVWPGSGATNWWSPSHDPSLGLLFVPVHEEPALFLTYDQAPRGLGEPNLEGGIRDVPGAQDIWLVRALRATTGEQVWDYRLEGEILDRGTGGLMSTASGLLFGGHQATFQAWASATGERLWSFPTGRAIAGAPVTYLAGGEQYVAVAAGGLVIGFGLPPGTAQPR
jgi:alcohol dehydrogenase (cytochrome c)